MMLFSKCVLFFGENIWIKKGVDGGWICDGGEKY